LKRIFITGVTGFIGGRLAEVACQRNISVVGLVRTWSRAARLSRLPVQMIHGDVLDPDSLHEAMKGCEEVFHCAVDNRIGGDAHHRVSVEGTANIMQAALDLGVKRVIHLSSVAVYSYRPAPDATTEEGGYHYSGDVYCDGKIDGEKVALLYSQEHALPVTVLRPTIVYGPFGDYTVDTLALIRQGRMVLVDGGRGVCNSLYIDNLVEAMLLAAVSENAVGNVFHISDASPISWKEFIEAHAQAIGDSHLPLREVTTQEVTAARKRTAIRRPSSLEQTLRVIRDMRTRRALRSVPVVERAVEVGKTVAKFVLPASTRRWLRHSLMHNNSEAPGAEQTESPRPLSQSEEYMVTAFDKVVFRIDKARRLLGYDPKIDFAEGMERTTEWIKWAQLQGEMNT
jgi:nucleoside-diphosphate-sugar epimerase